jgi:hypothetical protein
VGEGGPLLSKVGAGILRIGDEGGNTVIEAAMWPSDSASFFIDTCTISGLNPDLSEFTHAAQVRVGKRRATAKQRGRSKNRTRRSGKAGLDKGRALVLFRNRLHQSPRAVAVMTVHISRNRPLLIISIEVAGGAPPETRLMYESQLLQAAYAIARELGWGKADVEWQHESKDEAERVEKSHRFHRRPMTIARRLGFRPALVSYREAPPPR